MTDRTLTVQAAATREQTPDLATVELSAIGEGDSVAAARAASRDRAHIIENTVTAAPADRIKTVDVRVEDTEEAFSPDGDAQYQSTEKLHIACAAEMAEEVVVEVSDSGGRVQAIEFYVHEDVNQQLKEEALTEATERARRKADRIAVAEGLSVSGVEEIRTGEESSDMGNLVETALGRYEADNFYPAPVTVSESVTVTYALGTDTT
jgi:uncharacterized protein YggE